METYEIFPNGSEKNISNEILFDIPDSWEWVRLGSLGEYRKGPFGSTLTKKIFVPKSNSTIKVYEQKNVIKKDATLGSYYIAKEYFESCMFRYEVIPGDIMISCAGTIGESYIMPSDCERGIMNQALMRISLTNSILKNYYILFF